MGIGTTLSKLKTFAKGAAVAVGAIALTSCTYNEELGRSQLLLTGSQQMSQAAAGAWNDLKRQQRVSTDPRYTSRLNRVAPRVIRAAGGNPAEWEYLVFDSKDINAFALPGGKMGFYTGILDIMENDAQLAAVVGHEVAHVKFRHGAERYSQGILAQGALVGATVVGSTQCSGARTSADRSQCQQNAQRWVQALGIGAVYGSILPYSRKHEFEADSGGVRYMAAAGYDPNEAIDFWQNMVRATSGQARPPAWASTHPAPQSRIENIQNEIRRLSAPAGD